MLYYITYTHIPSKKAFGYAIAKMCSSLAAHTPVTLIIPRSAEREVTEDIFTFYNVPRNFAVREMPCLDLFRFKWLGKHIPFLLRKVTFSISVLFGLTIAREDVCYSRDLFSLVLLRLKTSQLFLEIHFLSKLDAVTIRLAHLAHKIVVITSFLKQELIALRYKENDILVAADAVDLADFAIPHSSQNELRAKLGLPQDKKIVLYWGNLIRWKGVYTLVDAVQYLPVDMQLVVVGGNEDTLPEFRRYVAGTEFAGRISVLGFKKHLEQAEYLWASDVLVIPNSGKERISSHNTSPLKLFEYMASGVPIVASDLPSMREIISEDNAFFAKPDDARDLAAVISRVNQNPDEAKKRAERAAELVKKYDWKNRAASVWNFIQR